MEAVKKYVAGNSSQSKPRKSKEDLILEEDRDAAMQTYHDIFALLAVLRQQLKIDTMTPGIRQKGWLNMLKHLSKEEVSKLVCDYIEEISKELAMIRNIAQNELEQRSRELR